MPWPNLTVQDVLDARKRLPARDPNTRSVRYPNGDIAFDIPFSAIARHILGGTIGWDEEVHELYLTPRAEHELRLRGELRTDP